MSENCSEKFQDGEGEQIYPANSEAVEINPLDGISRGEIVRIALHSYPVPQRSEFNEIIAGRSSYVPCCIN